MTKSDFIDWKKHPVTEKVFSQIREMIAGLQEELGQTAGVDVRLDVLRVGAIKAYQDLLDVAYEGDQE